ncbi:small ubiquitin protein, putative [Leishmania tarentolae]|uniref:Small ubiquitin protein, putative n=1 Tax=Leishmania tarentolae TaxID=5689 RepID=A0A640K905_LEITA|nr:small ubiquitin protein, putative [Leishmania tarentolae]
MASITSSSSIPKSSGVLISSIGAPSNRKRTLPREMPCFLQYASISFFSCVPRLILKNISAPSAFTTFREICCADTAAATSAFTGAGASLLLFPSGCWLLCSGCSIFVRVCTSAVCVYVCRDSRERVKACARP